MREKRELENVWNWNPLLTQIPPSSFSLCVIDWNASMKFSAIGDHIFVVLKGTNQWLTALDVECWCVISHCSHSSMDRRWIWFVLLDWNSLSCQSGKYESSCLEAFEDRWENSYTLSCDNRRWTDWNWPYWMIADGIFSEIIWIEQLFDL